MAINQINRPKFYEEQYLGAADLTAVVEYGRMQHARHALGAHLWGIAAGLQLRETAQPGGAVTMNLLPGYAWDGYGRPIAVLAPYRIPEALFGAIQYEDSQDRDGQGRLIKIWLRYFELPTQGPRPGFERCDGADQNARVQESFRVVIGEQATTTERYSGVAVGARNLTDATKALQTYDPAAPLVYDESVPHQTLPEQLNQARWLIPLGYVRWLPVQNQPGHFIHLSDDDLYKARQLRRYIGAVAEEIGAADSVIRLRDRGRDPKSVSFQPPTKQELKNGTNDLVWVEGHLRVLGDAKLCNGRLDFRDAAGDDLKIPLRLQRSNETDASVLQAVVGADPAKRNRFAVGPLKADGSFDEKFTVLGNGNVGVGITTPATPLHVMGDILRLEKNGKRLDLRTDGSSVDVHSETDHLYLRASGPNGKNNVVINQAATDGNVGIGMETPLNKLSVAGATGIRQNRLYLTGGDGWSSLAYNAYHNAANNAWVFPDPARKVMTIELDDRNGAPRCEVFSNLAADPGAWQSHFKIWGDTGNVTMAHSSGLVGMGTDAPTQRLEVRGHIKLHDDGSLFAPGGVENLRILRGNVQSDGSSAGGSGFSINKLGTGLYEVTFTNPFPGRPSASVTQVFPDFDGLNPGDSRDNAVIYRLTTTGMRVRTGDSAGLQRDRDFSFIVIGPR